MRHVGQSLPRREDPPLIAGRGRYTDDIRLDGALHLAFLRAPVPSGRIAELDTSEAAAMPGVAAVLTAADLGPLGALSVATPIPADRIPPFPVLADDAVTGLGQPVAAVLAGTRAQALDAAETILLDIDEGETVNGTVAEKHWVTQGCAAAFNRAALVVEATMRHPRLAPAPMEPRAIAVEYADGALTVWHGTQTPHRSRTELARILQLDPDRLRVIAPDVGGAFGQKASLYPEEVLAVWAARHLERSVRWTATRGEDLISATSGRGAESRGRLALDAEGRFLALEAEVESPVGPWLPTSALVPAWNAGRMLPSGYAIAEADITTRAVAHPTGPVGIYRGAGRPEAICLIERLVEEAARARGEDAIDLRRRNLLPSSALPHETPTGCRLDSGDFAGVVDRLAEAADLDRLRAERDRRRAQGELVGVALTFFVEPTGSGWESARVTLNADGGALVASGSSSQGHGRRTAYAQIAADALGIAPEAIEVALGDTGLCPEGIGALASRSTAIGGSAVLEAARAVAARRDAGEALPVTEEAVYEAEGEAWGAGAWCVMLSVDRDTGQASIERAWTIDDVGEVVSPASVAGQVMGGFAQGFGEAMMERLGFDADGQLLTGSFMDYAMPRAADVPPLTLVENPAPTPAPVNSLGARGVGEAGPIGAPPAILAAALDALAPLGVRDLHFPLTPEQLWRAIRDAQQGTDR
ncbi:xanthine dehydrogenase family protein molybdopterin-binding subunit [Rhodosalinus halophilus]|uniref:Xanthine dehydrogenase family protein molybdopterin-binding subunit n=1 Tax=Rhodosalinus halophilus TaxID=2259333 RepID=A0A365U7B8_9RHOB|nr:xanthine dehydrogenase family protein molybdopterin-binding subunit [Rhodosalinus halophilus]RBI83707.1 xanthine dehydrogenase family protein molybdopterin-binding subunit [Rhodosalinus halophilus]